MKGQAKCGRMRIAGREVEGGSGQNGGGSMSGDKAKLAGTK